MNFEELKGKKVLITGGAGFMGSHLTEALLELGARVSVFIRGTSVTSAPVEELRNIEHLRGRIETIIAGDIASPDTIKLIIQNKPEIIFHLAADAYVPRSFEQPLEVSRVNVDGTLHVLEAARALNVERVVITSSSEIYGPYPNPIAEDFPLNPTSPYGASKAAADRFAHSYWKTFGTRVAIIRPFNTYGPRHTYDVVPKFIALALAGKPLTVHGRGEQTRDLSYVDDTVRGFLIMGTHPAAVGEAVNFGTGKDVRIVDLAQKIIELCGSRSEIVFTPERLSEVSKLQCNPEKARRLFGYEARVSLDEGLRRNIAWTRERHK